jgi:hypothetical protein
MKHIKIFENWINESTEGLSKEVLNKDLENFIKTNPEKLETEEILPCGATVKTDDYSGVKTVGSKFMYLRSPAATGGSVTAKVSKEMNGPNSGKLSIYFSIANPATFIPNGEIFYIKFDDSSIMKLPTRGSDGHWDVDKIYHSYFFYPDPEQINILQTKKITGFSYYKAETKITNQSALRFIKTLNCVNDA